MQLFLALAIVSYGQLAIYYVVMGPVPLAEHF